MPDYKIDDDVISAPEGLLRPFHLSALAKGTYEGEEIALLHKTARPGDRILDFGAGIGLVSAHAAGIAGAEGLLCFEPNPAAAAAARALLRRKAPGATLREAMILGQGAEAGAVGLMIDGNNFLGSRTMPGTGAPAASQRLNDVVAEWRPDLLIVDVEGGESTLFQDARLDGVRTVLLELHPEIIGVRGCRDTVSMLLTRGFGLDPEGFGSQVVTLTRDPGLRRGPARPNPMPFLVASLQASLTARKGATERARDRLSGAREALPGNPFLALQMALLLPPDAPARAALLEEVSARPETARRALQMRATDALALHRPEAGLAVLAQSPHQALGYETALAARCLMALGEHDQALRRARAAAAAIPATGEVHQILAAALTGVGDTAAALDAIAAARRADPDLPGLPALETRILRRAAGQPPGRA